MRHLFATIVFLAHAVLMASPVFGSMFFEGEEAMEAHIIEEKDLTSEEAAEGAANPPSAVVNKQPTITIRDDQLSSFPPPPSEQRSKGDGLRKRKRNVNERESVTRDGDQSPSSSSKHMTGKAMVDCLDDCLQGIFRSPDSPHEPAPPSSADAVDNVHDGTASPSSSKGSSSLTAASQPALTLTALQQHTASHVGKPLDLAEKVRGMAKAASSTAPLSAAEAQASEMPVLDIQGEEEVQASGMPVLHIEDDPLFLPPALQRTTLEEGDLADQLPAFPAFNDPPSLKREDIIREYLQLNTEPPERVAYLPDNPTREQELEKLDSLFIRREDWEQAEEKIMRHVQDQTLPTEPLSELHRKQYGRYVLSHEDDRRLSCDRYPEKCASFASHSSFTNTHARSLIIQNLPGKGVFRKRPGIKAMVYDARATERQPFHDVDVDKIGETENIRGLIHDVPTWTTRGVTLPSEDDAFKDESWYGEEPELASADLLNMLSKNNWQNLRVYSRR